MKPVIRKSPMEPYNLFSSVPWHGTLLPYLEDDETFAVCTKIHFCLWHALTE
uniref:Uncharacterized protein n=1 Tax=Arundo donax TaxID=35708 RepID=A0A0A9FDR9_ARUDO